MEMNETSPTCTEDSFMTESDPDAIMPTVVTLATPDVDDVLMTEGNTDSQVSHDHTYCEKTTPTYGDHTHSEKTMSSVTIFADLNHEDDTMVTDEEGVAKSEMGITTSEVGMSNKEELIDQSQELFSPEVINTVGVVSDMGVTGSVVEDKITEDVTELDTQEGAFQERELEVQPDHLNLEPKLLSPPPCEEETKNQNSLGMMAPDIVSSEKIGFSAVHNSDILSNNVEYGLIPEGTSSLDTTKDHAPSEHHGDLCVDHTPSEQCVKGSNVDHTPSEHNGQGSSVDHTPRAPSTLEKLRSMVDSVEKEMKDNPDMALDRREMFELMERMMTFTATLCSRLKTQV